MKLQDDIEPEYFDLKALAAYSSCSVRWLRDRLVDRNRPLPHHRIEGKLLVKREDFDVWMSAFRVISPIDQMNEIVESVMAHVRPSKRAA